MSDVITEVQLGNSKAVTGRVRFRLPAGARILGAHPSDSTPWLVQLVVAQPAETVELIDRTAVWVRSGQAAPAGQLLASIDGPDRRLIHLFLLDDPTNADLGDGLDGEVPAWSI